jgi:prepilin-type N-terminal cleavage/methylation domain-containing protein
MFNEKRSELLSRRVAGFDCVPGRTRSGFTLIELLVAIAVIAILASILLAGVSRVRSRAHDVKCASNLRAIGTALLCYSSEKGSYPFPDDEGGYEYWASAPFLIEKLSPYLGADRVVWYCPAYVEEFNLDTNDAYENGSDMYYYWGFRYTNGGISPLRTVSETSAWTEEHGDWNEKVGGHVLLSDWFGSSRVWGTDRQLHGGGGGEVPLDQKGSYVFTSLGGVQLIAPRQP